MDGAPGSKRQRTDGTLARASAREVPGTLPGTVREAPTRRPGTACYQRETPRPRLRH